MTQSMNTHPAAKMYADEHEAGDLSRREFLARTTALGVTAAGAYGLIGLETPAHAAAHATKGGTLRMQMEVRALKDPRTYDWTQIAFVTAGLSIWSSTTRRYIQRHAAESWEANADATEYTLNVRQGRQVEQWRRLHS